MTSISSHDRLPLKYEDRLDRVDCSNLLDSDDNVDLDNLPLARDFLYFLDQMLIETGHPLPSVGSDGANFYWPQYHCCTVVTKSKVKIYWGGQEFVVIYKYRNVSDAVSRLRSLFDSL